MCTWPENCPRFTYCIWSLLKLDITRDFLVAPEICVDNMLWSCFYKSEGICCLFDRLDQVGFLNEVTLKFYSIKLLMVLVF